MMRLGFFRREVEVFLHLMGGALVLGAFVLTLAWGYTQRQAAEAWRAQACTYRFADLARRATFLGDDTRNAFQVHRDVHLERALSGSAARHSERGERDERDEQGARDA